MVTFKDLPIGTTFRSNGIVAVKHSTRTGKLQGVGRIFYWGKNESVSIVK